jgi:dienelactone hydrolase
MTSLSSGSDTPFSAAAQCHPAFRDPSEALNVSIPMCLLPSMDEDVEDVKQYMENLKGPKRAETFKDMVHGWISAKGDLEDPHKKEEFERGYRILLEFFGQYL